MSKTWELCLHNLASQRLMLKTLDKLKVQNKKKCALCIYKILM